MMLVTGQDAAAAKDAADLDAVLCTEPCMNSRTKQQIVTVVPNDIRADEQEGDYES
jgi:hypothetical protein